MGGHRYPPLSQGWGWVGQRRGFHGTAGSGGFMPQMIAGVPANIGNVDFKVGLGNALGGAGAILAVAGQTSPPFTQIGGTSVLIDMGSPLIFPTIVVGPAAAGAGFATILSPLPDEPSLSGLTLFSQWFVFDPGISAIAASSNAAELSLF